MTAKITLSLLVATCLFAGCSTTTRSISQSGYVNEGISVAPPARELDEFEVLGLDRDQAASEEDIRRALRESKRVQLAPGSAILLVQSGAVFPDGAMVQNLSKSYRVVPFTGLTAQPMDVTRLSHLPLSAIAKDGYQTAKSPGAYSRTLRLAAARAGASAIVCYWGILESGSESLATKTITWIPTVNWVIPDEKQHMRINVKVAVVDVATGGWSVFSVQPPDTSSIRRNTRREVIDQNLVESLKEKAYELAAQNISSAFH